MNKNIRKITQGAMFLAILGAAILINRELSFIFDVYISLIISLIIIVYAKKFSLKDSFILSICIFIISFLFGGLYLLAYTPLAILAGIIYSYGLKKNYERRKILFYLIILFSIGEYILSLVILPLLGYSDIDTTLISTADILKQMGIYIDSESFKTIAKASIGASLVFVGVMEALMIHLCTIFIFKKFRLGIIKMQSIDQIKIKAQTAYIAILFILISIISLKYITIDEILYAIIAIAMLSALLLIAQGYIFSLIYGIIKYNKNISLMVIIATLLLFPYSMLILLLLGFLYATGPLEDYLNKKRGN